MSAAAADDDDEKTELDRNWMISYRDSPEAFFGENVLSLKIIIHSFSFSFSYLLSVLYPQ